VGDQHRENQDDNQGGPLSGERVSRRQFLKLAGVTGAAVTVGGGLAGLLSSCGGETTTTTAAGATTTAGAATSTTAGKTATTAAAGGSAVIKIGNLTDFAIPPLVNTRKALEAVVEGVNADGGYNVGGTTYHA
jgi:hypothetical protein